MTTTMVLNAMFIGLAALFCVLVLMNLTRTVARLTGHVRLEAAVVRAGAPLVWAFTMAGHGDEVGDRGADAGLRT